MAAAIRREAEESFSSQLYRKSLRLYEEALELCQHSLVNEVASANSNCAKVYLKLQNYDKALTHAEECIRLNPKSHEVRDLIVT